MYIILLSTSLVLVLEKQSIRTMYDPMNTVFWLYDFVVLNQNNEGESFEWMSYI